MPFSVRSLVGSRFGLRVIGIFALAALVPLALAGWLMLNDFREFLAERDREDLDGLVRLYGMSLFGRLASTDQMLRASLAGSDRSALDLRIDGLVREADWIRSVHRLPPSERSPDPRSRLRIERAGEGATDARVFLSRGLSDGGRIELELAPPWLWADLPAFAVDATLLVLGPDGARLALDGPQQARAGDRAVREALQASRSRHAQAEEPSSGDWVAGSWELFLGGRFDAASWRVAAFRPATSIVDGLEPARLQSPALVVLVLLLVSLAGVRLIRRELRPLERLVDATRKIGRLEFPDPVRLDGADEFTDLARSFNGMTSRLRAQFSALGALTEIDRVLLQSHGLEPILDTVMPRIAEVLHCRWISVLLIDADALNHGRVYEFVPSEDAARPVRRVVAGVADLRAIAARDPAPELDAGDARLQAFLGPLAATGARRVQLAALVHDGDVRGILAAGFEKGDLVMGHSTVTTGDFADRLSVVLANLARAEKLYEQANFDPLTRLANRQQFREALARRLHDVQGCAAAGALLYIDLDQFKQINDTSGHSMGDAVLRIVADRLRSCFRPDDVIARLGGDEFAVIVELADEGDSARTAAQRVIECLRAPLQVGKREFHVNASIGITLFPADGDSIEELLKKSDMAMYRAKESGRGCAVFFETEMQERMQARALLESGMHRALTCEEFRLAYQPIVSVGGGGRDGVEALIRWPSAPTRDAVSPAVFMPIAEESNLINGLGEWVLRTACADFAAWRRRNGGIGYVSVNVSARQLRDPAFAGVVDQSLLEAGLSPGDLQIEITEGVLADGDSVASTLERLAQSGVQIALDDFGTGYSSLGYLRRFPIRSVKIDRSFITEIPASEPACNLVRSIIAMTQVLGKDVVAEGVETGAQLEFLRSAGCGSIQGYHVARPMEAAAVPDFFEGRTAAAARPPLRRLRR